MINWNGEIQKQYYKEFTVYRYGNNYKGDVTLTISGLPLDRQLGFYIVKTDSPAGTPYVFSQWFTGDWLNGTYTITIPNGTYRVFHYTKNNYVYTDGLAPQIKIEYDADLIKIDETSTETELSSGEVVNTPFNYHFMCDVVQDGGLSTPHCNYYHVMSSNSFFPLSTTQGNSTGYSLVTETTTDKNGIVNGKIVYQYISPNTIPDLIGGIPSNLKRNYWPYPPADNMDWKRGSLKKKEIFDYVSGKFNLVEESSYSYKTSTQIVGDGRKIDFAALCRSNPYGSYTAPANVGYNISSGSSLPETITTTSYKPAVTSSTTANVYSTENLLPIKTTTTRSDGSLLHTFLSYPLEYSDNSGFVKKLVDNNIVNVPIEKVTAIEKNGSTSITSGIINTYKDNNLGQIDQVMQLETNSPIAKSGFQFSSKTPGTLPTESTSKNSFSPDQRYKSKILFDSYDSKGNIQQIHKDGDINTVYLWGYGSTLPVVEIQNITKSIIPDALVSEIASHAFSTSTDRTDVDADISYLKTQLAGLISNPNYMVTFYTYKPLVGMTSKTDPRGITTYYIYDTFNRLYLTRNNDKKIVSQYRYAYQGLGGYPSLIGAINTGNENYIS
jgi:hypothetical protein